MRRDETPIDAATATARPPAADRLRPLLLLLLAALGLLVAPALSGAAGGTAAPAVRDGSHDFDFHFGTWTTHVRRLLHPLSGDGIWADYDGTSEVSRVWGGRASLLVLEVSGPAGHLEGLGLRLYNPASGQWSLNWANSGAGTTGVPMVGEFRDGRGEFFDREPWNGRIISVRNGFSDITPNSSRFEQAFSDDGGKTWETNWIMTFTRAR